MANSVWETEIVAAFPWAQALPEGDRETFARELAGLLDADDMLARVTQFLTEWQHTAEAYADPELREALSKPAGDFGPVPEPNTRDD